MKKIEKFILPGLIVVIVGLLYFFYFAPSDELGSFTMFDKDSNASLPIVVKYATEKGVQRDTEGSIFFVVDRTGKEVRVSGPAQLPVGFESSNSIEIMGHLSGNGFHAHGVKVKN
jgi:hypothetical protein